MTFTLEDSEEVNEPLPFRDRLRRFLEAMRSPEKNIEEVEKTILRTDVCQAEVEAAVYEALQNYEHSRTRLGSGYLVTASFRAASKQILIRRYNNCREALSAECIAAVEVALRR